MHKNQVIHNYIVLKKVFFHVECTCTCLIDGGDDRMNNNQVKIKHEPIY